MDIYKETNKLETTMLAIKERMKDHKKQDMESDETIELIDTINTMTHDMLFHIEGKKSEEAELAKEAIQQAQKAVRFWLSFNLKQFL